MKAAVYLLLAALSLSAPARADVSQISEQEFQSLAAEIAPKVKLFRDAWNQDPQAEVFGGSVRDYLYWLRGAFREAKSRTDAEKIIRKLRALPEIEARDFLLAESDVDLVSARTINLDANEYGIKKIDQIDATRLDPHTSAGIDEINQGYIPLEKIRLGRHGFAAPTTFGDGLHEIYTARPTLHMPDAATFAQTSYAKQKLNHQVLLAVRYVRSLGINYYQKEGRGFPDEKALFDIDPTSEKFLQESVDLAQKDKELNPYLKVPRFKYWLNQTIQKAFRSETNPTATHMLFKKFGLDKVVGQYSDHLDPINQYLFAKPKLSEAEVRAMLAKLGTTPEQLFIPAHKEFPNLALYHGTKTEESFRSIISQGVLPSASGHAGPGLYGVNKNNIGFAADWAENKDRVVVFEVEPKARVLDATEGLGAKLLDKLDGNFSDLADATGADIIRYPYTTTAYVVKNSTVLERPTGYTREFKSLAKLLEKAAKASTVDDTMGVLKSLQLNNFTTKEISQVLAEVPFLKAPENKKLASLIVNIADYPVSNELRTASLRAVTALNVLSASAAAGTDPAKLNRAREESTEAINELIRAVSVDDALSEADKNEFLKTITHSVFDANNPEGNSLVRTALVKRTEKISPEIMKRLEVYMANPMRKGFALLSGGLAATFVPAGILLESMVHFPMSTVAETVALPLAGWGAVLHATLKDAKNDFDHTYGHLDSAQKKQNAKAILALQKYFASLEKGKSLKLKSYQASQRSLNPLALPGNCMQMYSKLWKYDQNIAIGLGGGTIIGGYYLTDYLADVIFSSGDGAKDEAPKNPEPAKP